MHIMKRFFSTLEEKSIKYVHFKSNCHLADSFSGKGDFDVLVDKTQISELSPVLSDFNAKSFSKVRYGIYPGVENWLFFDEESGIIHHLHLHFHLISGKQYLKDYIIPWDELLFSTRVKDPEYGIYIADPNVELLLLTVRSVIKSHIADWAGARIGRYHLHSSLNEERKALLMQADEHALAELVKTLFPGTSQEELLALVTKPEWNGHDFTALSEMIRKELADNRRYSPAGSEIRSVLLWTGDKYNKVLRRKFGLCRIEKKVSPNSGKIIAFVGVDGSGKSTTTDEIYHWMYKQIESKRFYMGTGDGKTNLFVTALKAANHSVKKHSGNKSGNRAAVSFREKPFLYIKKLAAAEMVYSVEKSNRKKLLAMDEYRRKGGISLLDRYPQIEVTGANDGPKIPIYQKQIKDSSILNKLAEEEIKQLSIVERIKPDLVFRLNISAETSMERKPEQTDIEVFREKIDNLHEITYQGARIIDINAEQPYADELTEIKKIIWENL